MNLKASEWVCFSIKYVDFNSINVIIYVNDERMGTGNRPLWHSRRNFDYFWTNPVTLYKLSSLFRIRMSKMIREAPKLFNFWSRMSCYCFPFTMALLKSSGSNIYYWNSNSFLCRILNIILLRQVRLLKEVTADLSFNNLRWKWESTYSDRARL